MTHYLENEANLNTLLIFGVALFNCITAYLGYLSHQAIKEVGKNVAIIEKATNSMKDALVASTDKAARSEGRAEGLELGRSETREPGHPA